MGRWTGALRRRLVSSRGFACTLGEDDVVIDLANAERAALLVLGVLGPLVVADFRLPRGKRIRSSDASIRGIAGCSTKARRGRPRKALAASD